MMIAPSRFDLQSPSNSAKAGGQKLSLLGILFFMFGAPNLYAFFNSRLAIGANLPRYLRVVLIAVAIAGLVELGAKMG
ncbi:MAG: hypothetical protein AAGF66_08135 [Cyanobacteria bacterium P01_H01_bin.119]